MFETLIAAIGGGGFGFIGSIASRLLAVFEEYQKRKTLAIHLQHELKLQEIQLKHRVDEREAEAEIAHTEAQMAGLVHSYRHDAAYRDSRLQWVRPFLTTFSFALVGVFYFHSDTAAAVRVYIALSCVSMASASFTWWFADRGRRPA